MADEQIIRLLEEIRDLQKQHFDDYKTALQNQQLAMQNQQQSIEMQSKAVARQKLIAIAVFVVITIGFAAIFFTTGFAR